MKPDPFSAFSGLTPFLASFLGFSGTTHLCDDSFAEAMDHFQGRVWASHSNCRALVPHERQFTDEQLKLLIQRGAVIGAALDAWMMVPGWERGKTKPQDAGVTLEHMLEERKGVRPI